MAIELPSLSYSTSDVAYFRLLSLRGRLQLEIRGMKGRYPRTAYSLIKKEFKLQGSRESVLRQFSFYIEMVKERNLGIRHNWVSRNPNDSTQRYYVCMCGHPYDTDIHACLGHELKTIFHCICSKKGH